MPLVHLCVAGVQPPHQCLALPDDAKVYDLTYEYGGQEHRLLLQTGSHLVPASPPSSSSSSLGSSASPGSSTNTSLPPKSTKRKRPSSVDAMYEGKQQQQQQRCVTVWYDTRPAQSDATDAPRDGEAKQPPLPRGVVCNTTQPQRLDALPGSPVVWVCAGEGAVEEVAMMARAVRGEFSWVDVPEDIEATEDDIKGDFYAEIKLPGGPRRVTCHDGLVYVTHEEPNHGAVSAFNVADRKLVQTLHLDGKGWANGVVVHEQSVYIANGGLDCIQVYGLDGTFQRQFGTTGSGPGQLSNPWGLAITGGERETLLYVCDALNDRVQVFDLTGSHVRSFGARGGGPGEFQFPTALAVDAECVYVCDANNHRVQGFRLDGTFEREWGSNGVGEGEFFWPQGVVVQGELLYVSDQGNHRVQVFDKKTGTFVRSWGSQGNGHGQFRWPGGMVLTDDGDQLWVCDTTNHRIQIFR